MNDKSPPRIAAEDYLEALGAHGIDHLFVNPGNGIGISGIYHGSILPDTWHRVAFVFDLSLSSDHLRKFVDGALVGTQSIGGVDGRWALDPAGLLFTDEDNETASGFVNSIQFHDAALPDGYITALGGATAAGVPVPEPSTLALVAIGALGILGLRLRRFARRH